MIANRGVTEDAYQRWVAPRATKPTTMSGDKPISARANRWTFGVGTVGRDMAYTLQSMFLIVFLTEVLDLPDATMWWVSASCSPPGSSTLLPTS